MSSWILELDRGNAYPFEGNYSGWLEAKASRAAAEAKVCVAQLHYAVKNSGFADANGLHAILSSHQLVAYAMLPMCHVSDT